MKHAVFAHVAFALAAAAGLAHAQPTRDPVGAEALFNSAKQLLKRGDWTGACAKFRASMDLDAAVATLLKIARCHEHEGKLALAWYDYQRALKLNDEATDKSEHRKQTLAKYANKALKALEPRVPKLRIVVDNAPAGLKITRNGHELPVTVLGEALPVDPGVQDVVAVAPDRPPVRQSVEATEGKITEVRLVFKTEPVVPADAVVGPQPPFPPPLPLPAPWHPVKPAPPPRPPAPRATPDTGRSQRIAGIVISAVGVAGLGAAGSLGIHALVNGRASADYCYDDGTCKSAGVTLRDNARAAQTAAFVAFGVGTAVFTTGLAVFFTAPRRTARIGVGPSGVSGSASW